MAKEKPFIWLQREGKYFVELGDTALGNLARIDNYIANLPSHCEKLRHDRENLMEREKAIKSELSDDKDYSAAIEQKKRKLRELDDELGVEKDE